MPKILKISPFLILRYMIKNCCRGILLLLIFLSSNNSFSQKPNAYKFIQPNISIGYDSNYFRVAERFSNTVYETEAFYFRSKTDAIHEVKIYVQAGHPSRHPTTSILDSQLNSGLKQIREIVENDSLKVVTHDTIVRHLQGFSCIGFVGYDPIQKTQAAIISGFHFSDDDKSEFRYTSVGRNDLDKEYEILQTSFLLDFKTYSEKEINAEERLIRSSYTVIVSPTTKFIDSFSFRRKTFVGVVKVKQPLKHKLAEVELINSYGSEIFSPNRYAGVPIVIYDDRKGKIVKKGNLIMVNSFGKKVKIPFSFSYLNKGELPFK